MALLNFKKPQINSKTEVFNKCGNEPTKVVKISSIWIVLLVINKLNYLYYL